MGEKARLVCTKSSASRCTCSSGESRLQPAMSSSTATRIARQPAAMREAPLYKGMLNFLEIGGLAESRAGEGVVNLAAEATKYLPGAYLHELRNAVRCEQADGF